MNSRQIQYAIALSKTLNFSQSALELGITQPSLSKQIMNLENELGVKLFDRNHSPMTLTPAGEYFIVHAQEIVHKEAELYKAIEGFQSGENGSLTIGVTPFRSLYLMPEVVKKVKERYPGVKVTPCEENSAHLRTEVCDGKYDFAIVNLPVDESVLDVTVLDSDTLVLAVPKDMTQNLPEYNKDELNSIDFSKASDLPFIVLSSSQEMRELFDKLCARAQFTPNIACEVVGMTTAWSMARAGIGAALLPLQFIKNFSDENICLYKIKSKLYSRQPAVVCKRGQYMSEYAKYAISLLTE